MNVEIHSRKSMEELLKKDYLKYVAVISFYDPISDVPLTDYAPIDYTSKCNRVFQIAIPDIHFDELEEYNLTYDTYFSEVDRLAEFIITAKNNGLDIICQCEYGESRSAGCASAILEYYYQNGISVFADYRYSPNQLVFNKVLASLKNTIIEL